MEMEQDLDMVVKWLRRDPTRWVAGFVGGIFAGMVMLALTGLLATAGGYEFLFPTKMMALPILGNSATAYGLHPTALITGLLLTAAVGGLLGSIFSHFTWSNSIRVLIPMGVVWGLFTWIFITNLFIQSFRDVKAVDFSRGTSLFASLVFGLSLTSISLFDRAMRGRA